MQGTIKKWFPDRGYGFITAADGTDVFVHVRAIRIEPGTAVEFEVAEGERGPAAANVAVLAQEVKP